MKKLCNFTYNKINGLPIEGFILINECTSAELNIQDDITALESVKLSLLITFATKERCDFLTYIKEKKLERHFIIEEG